MAGCHIDPKGSGLSELLELHDEPWGVLGHQGLQVAVKSKKARGSGEARAFFCMR